MGNIQLIKKKPTISIGKAEKQKPENKVPKSDYSPGQRRSQRPRPINYRAFPEIQEMARDIITMYVTIGLGESAIRHVIGLDDDKPIEDVVRQHNFGRNNLDKGKYVCTTKLYCPNKKELDSLDVRMIQRLCDKYGTLSDPYNVKLIEEKTWNNDPAYIKDKNCPKCNHVVPFEDNFCPKCGYQIRRNVKYVKEL